MGVQLPVIVKAGWTVGQLPSPVSIPTERKQTVVAHKGEQWFDGEGSCKAGLQGFARLKQRFGRHP